MVLIGSARSNENGGITGGKPGDQKGGAEVSTQAWYRHSKGWIVIRAKEPVVREKIAKNMEAACRNDHIGYCQTHRGTATAAAKPYGYDLSKVTKDVETDCSELVKVCCLYAGIQVGSFSTANESAALAATNQFLILQDAKYTESSNFLRRGDILVTKSKGHTVVVLTDGEKTQVKNSIDQVTKTKAAEEYEKNLSGTYVVTASALNFRAGAGIDQKSIGILAKGTNVKCYGYYTAAFGVKWLLVQTNGNTGYCSEKYLKKI